MKLYFSRFSRKQIIWTGVIVVLLIVTGFMFFGRNKNTGEQTVVISRGNFVKDVSVSGKVVASENVDLSFPETGRVSSLPVKVGDQVLKGQVLASITSASLLSELQSARAVLAQKIAERSNTETNLDSVTKEQNTLVANAYNNLLSNDLVAVPSNNNTTATPPIITGLYKKGVEGKYKLIVRRSDGSSINNYSLNVFDLETATKIKILNDEATAIAAGGLFISFPDTLSDYNETMWYVTIPNKQSATYLSVYNAYQEALRTRDREITNAGADLSSNNASVTISEAEIQNAQSDVARIQAQISERTIYAPFSGIVTTVNSKLGGIASANEAAISMISADTLQIESYVPEIHVPFIKLGDQATVTLDAYGTEVPFMATVISIDPAETIRDGVSTYRAKLEFAEKDARVKSGMTANVIINTENKTDVIAVPQGAVMSRDGKKFVLVKESGNKNVEREVTTGSVSSLGEIEITSGLNDGDIVVISQAPTL